MVAGGRHVGPPGETPKSPQSPEHVFGPEENKGTTVDTTRNDAKLLFPSNFKHLLTHYPRFWAKLRQLESMYRCLELEQTPFVPSDVQIHIDLGDFEDLGQSNFNAELLQASSTFKQKLQLQLFLAKVVSWIFFADLHCTLQINLFASAGDQKTSQQLRCESPDHTTSSVVWVSPTALRALSVQSS